MEMSLLAGTMQKRPHAKGAKAAKKKVNQQEFVGVSHSLLGERAPKIEDKFLCDLCGLRVRDGESQLHRSG